MGWLILSMARLSVPVVVGTAPRTSDRSPDHGPEQSAGSGRNDQGHASNNVWQGTARCFVISVAVVCGGHRHRDPDHAGFQLTLDNRRGFATKRWTLHCAG